MDDQNSPDVIAYRVGQLERTQKEGFARLETQNGELAQKLDNLSVVNHEVFKDYQKHVENTYVTKAEIDGLMRAWKFANSLITKLLVGALVAIAIWGAVQSADVRSFLPPHGGQ